MSSLAPTALHFFHGRQGQLAYQVLNPEGQQAVVALHGWLDNSASFSLLAEYLPDYKIYALDLPGHGLSQHYPLGFYHLWEYLPALAEFVESLGQPVALWGHSMGGMVAPLLALAEPETIQSLVLIDSLGGPPYGSKDLLAWLNQCRQRPRPHVPYADFADMVRVRMRGMTPLSYAAAERLCRHQAKPLSAGGWQWTFDPAIKLGSPVRLRDDDYQAALQALAVPSLVILAQEGWVAQHLDVTQRLGWLNAQAQVKWLPGGHHCHLETHEVLPCAQAILEFYASHDQP